MTSAAIEAMKANVRAAVRVIRDTPAGQLPKMPMAIGVHAKGGGRQYLPQIIDLRLKKQTWREIDEALNFHGGGTTSRRIAAQFEEFIDEAVVDRVFGYAESRAQDADFAAAPRETITRDEP